MGGADLGLPKAVVEILSYLRITNTQDNLGDEMMVREYEGKRSIMEQQVPLGMMREPSSPFLMPFLEELSSSLQRTYIRSTSQQPG